MLDLTSSLYLGLRHASESLRPWAQLTTGAPAALTEPVEAQSIAGRLARLIGAERGTLAPSTLHAYWDLFPALGPGRAIYVDDGSYPIARWAVERATCRGTPTTTFAHHDARALGSLVEHDAASGRRPVVVADGWCPGCGRPAPIAEYLRHVRPHGGALVLDDTQALGILGRSPSPAVPFGHDGGGSLRQAGAYGSDVVVVASAAKGFGAPVAIVAGEAGFVERFERTSETRVHCSQPSFADLRAADRALDLNQAYGDALRARLARRVRAFRRGLGAVGLVADGALFPVQSVIPPSGTDAPMLHRRLLARGVRTVLYWPVCGSGLRVGFIIRATLAGKDIDRALRALAGAIGSRDGLPARQPAPA